MFQLCSFINSDGTIPRVPILVIGHREQPFPLVLFRNFTLRLISLFSYIYYLINHTYFPRFPTLELVFYYLFFALHLSVSLSLSLFRQDEFLRNCLAILVTRNVRFALSPFLWYFCPIPKKISSRSTRCTKGNDNFRFSHSYVRLDE